MAKERVGVFSSVTKGVGAVEKEWMLAKLPKLLEAAKARLPAETGDVFWLSGKLESPGTTIGFAIEAGAVGTLGTEDVFTGASLELSSALRNNLSIRTPLLNALWNIRRVWIIEGITVIESTPRMNKSVEPMQKSTSLYQRIINRWKKPRISIRDAMVVMMYTKPTKVIAICNRDDLLGDM